jgi:uncharacterized protein YjiS (DUF1127 family)
MKPVTENTMTLPARHAPKRRNWIDRIGVWLRRANEREALLAMSDRELRDIGISRLDAWCEAQKPPWRA